MTWGINDNQAIEFALPIRLPQPGIHPDSQPNGEGREPDRQERALYPADSAMHVELAQSTGGA
jgi:hypothetical protein